MRVKDICILQNGRAFKPDDWSPNGIPIVRIQNLNDENAPFNYFQGEYDSVHEVNDGELLFSWSGTPGTSFGAFRWNRGKGVLNQHIFKVIPKIDVDKEYLRYAFNGNLNAIISKAHGGVGLQHITKKELDEIEIPIVSLADQHEIVSILHSVEKILVNRQLELAKLDDLIKARFVEIFEQGNYPQVAFGDVCEFLRNGASIKQTKGAGGYPITRIETLSNDVFNTDRLGYADIFELGKYENYLLKRGDILISHINSVAYLGRAVQYRGETDSPIIHGMNLLCARIVEGYNPTYIEFFFKTPMAKDYISTITKKAVNQASITTSDLKKMMVPAPSIEEQNEFDRFVLQVDKSKVVIHKSLNEAQLLFDRLMQEYFE